MDADRIVEQYLKHKQSPADRSANTLSLDGTPRGIRNNNPGNIRGSAEQWRGQTGVDYGGMCVFESAHWGLRALAKLLLTYQTRYGLCTINTIIDRWAPPEENDTAAYVRAVCDETRLGADTWLRLSESSVLCALVRAIVQHENGQQPYDDAEISGAVEAAYE